MKRFLKSMCVAGSPPAPTGRLRVLHGATYRDGRFVDDRRNAARITLTILMVTALLLICSRGTACAQGSPAPSPSSAHTRWPNYAAVDYDKPGHPTLTPEEVASIRSALARVKHCQRTLVRYAFPANASSWHGRPSFVLFFQTDGGGAHIFENAGELYFTISGDLIPTSNDDPVSEQVEKFGIQFLINHQECAPALK